MMAEARRIKMTVEYPNQINETLQRRSSREIIDESDVEYDDDDMSMESAILNIGPSPAPKG